MKRNRSCNFYPQDDIARMQEWLNENILAAMSEKDKSKLKQKVRLNICFDPDNKMTMVPKGFV